MLEQTHQSPANLRNLLLEETGKDIAFLCREIAASPLHVHLSIDQNYLSPTIWQNVHFRRTAFPIASSDECTL